MSRSVYMYNILRNDMLDKTCTHSYSLFTDVFADVFTDVFTDVL